MCHVLPVGVHLEKKCFKMAFDMDGHINQLPYLTSSFGKKILGAGLVWLSVHESRGSKKSWFDLVALNILKRIGDVTCHF